jgi:hypothetical protein
LWHCETVLEVVVVESTCLLQVTYPVNMNSKKW